MNKSLLNQRMEAFRNRCKDLGLAFTYQRLSTYRALLQADHHPSPEDLFRVVKEAYPSISLATIYKTLDRFEKLGLIAKVNVLHETARYDPRTEHHHHVVCVDCKRCEDVEPEALAAWGLPRDVAGLGLPEPTVAGWDLRDYSIMFQGLCRDCARQRAPASAAEDKLRSSEPMEAEAAASPAPQAIEPARPLDGL